MTAPRVHDLPDIEHGTPRGASMHRRRGEVACKPCHRAENRRKAQWTAARNAAIARLCRTYAREYLAMLAEEQEARGLRRGQA